MRVKPTSAEVEVDLAVDVDSKNYDASADPKLKMDKQVAGLEFFSFVKKFVTTCILMEVTRYVIIPCSSFARLLLYRGSHPKPMDAQLVFLLEIRHISFISL